MKNTIFRFEQAFRIFSEIVQANFSRTSSAPEQEHNAKLHEKRVLFIAPIYNYYPILVHALQLQSHKNWQLILIHDGPNSTGLQETVEQLKDERVTYHETTTRHNDWGHTLRQEGLEKIKNGFSGDYVIITNADNYYAPCFIESMLKALKRDTVAVYCNMVHSHRSWNIVSSLLRRKFIDCGCVMVKRDVALEVGWQSKDFAADWFYVKDILAKYPKSSFSKVNKPLFVHN
ncbi:glycosyltransferase family 2 protein [Phormidium tenue FACHB-886]|nr:glycosyltransferase family 2 protein [Phormidium tenue FACHB-886]